MDKLLPMPDLKAILLDWTNNVFNAQLYVCNDAIEYGGFILILLDNDIKRCNSVRSGCQHAVCLDEFSPADPEFFEKIKPAIKKRIEYLNSQFI